MIPAHNPLTPQSEENLVTTGFARLVQASRRLLHDISNGRTDSPHFDDVHDLLGSAPLTTEEYSLGIQQLRKAMRYSARGDMEAARNELNALIDSFIAQPGIE